MSELASVPLSPPPRAPPARIPMRPRASAIVPPHPPVPQPPPPTFPRHPPMSARRVEFSPPFKPHYSNRGVPSQQPPLGEYRHHSPWHPDRAPPGASRFQTLDGRRRAMSRDESKMTNRPVPPLDSQSRKYPPDPQNECLLDCHVSAHPYSNANLPLSMCQPGLVNQGSAFNVGGPRMPPTEGRMSRSKSGDGGVNSTVPNGMRSTGAPGMTTSMPGLALGMRSNPPGGPPTVGSPSSPDRLLCDLYLTQVAFPGSESPQSTNLLHLEFLSHLQSLMSEIDTKSTVRLHGGILSKMQIRALPLELSWCIPMASGACHGDVDPLRQLFATLRRQQPTPLKYLFRVTTPPTSSSMCLCVTDLIGNISCDVTINNSWGVLLSEMLQKYALIHPSIQIATQFILHYAVKCNLVVPPPGLDNLPDGQQDYRREGNRPLPTLSNLSVVLVLWLRYLIEANPNVPTVSQLLLGGLGTCKSLVDNDLTVEGLLARFFDFCGSVDLGKSVISIRTGAPPLVFGDPSTATPTSLMIIDPFLDRNLAGSWSPNDVLRLVHEFQRAAWTSPVLQQLEPFGAGGGRNGGRLIAKILEDPALLSEWLCSLMHFPSAAAAALQYEGVNTGWECVDSERLLIASMPSPLSTRAQLEDEIRRLHVVQGILADRVRFVRNDRWWSSKTNPGTSRRDRTESCTSGLSGTCSVHWSSAHFTSGRRLSRLDPPLPPGICDAINGSSLHPATRTYSEGLPATCPQPDLSSQRPPSPRGNGSSGIAQPASDDNASGLCSTISFPGVSNEVVSLDADVEHPSKETFTFGVAPDAGVTNTSASSESLANLVQRHFCNQNWNWNNPDDLYSLVSELLKDQPGWYLKLSRIESRIWASPEVSVGVVAGENSSVQLTAPGGTVFALFPEGTTKRPPRVEICLSWNKLGGVRLGTAESLSPISFQHASTTLEIIDPQWIDIANNGKSLAVAIDTKTGAIHKVSDNGPDELLFPGIAAPQQGQSSHDLWRIPTVKVPDEMSKTTLTIKHVVA